MASSSDPGPTQAPVSDPTPATAPAPAQAVAVEADPDDNEIDSAFGANPKLNSFENSTERNRSLELLNYR